MLGPQPVIASLSLGATRTFRLKNMACPQGTQAAAATPHTQSQPQQMARQLSAGRYSTPHPETDGPNAPADQQQHGHTASGSLRIANTTSQAVVSADVQLPHNTLVIMWPPAQEAWKHEVVLSSGLYSQCCNGTCLCSNGVGDCSC